MSTDWRRHLLPHVRPEAIDCPTTARIIDCAKMLEEAHLALASKNMKECIRLLAEVTRRSENKFLNMELVFQSDVYSAAVKMAPPLDSESVLSVTPEQGDALIVRMGGELGMNHMWMQIEKKASEGSATVPKDIGKFLSGSLDRYKLAVKDCKRLLASDARLWVVIGGHEFIRFSQIDDAVVSLKKALDLSEADAWGAHYTLGNLYNNLSAHEGTRPPFKNLEKKVKYSKMANEHMAAFLKFAPDCHWNSALACCILFKSQVHMNVRGPSQKIADICKEKPDAMREAYALYRRLHLCLLKRSQWAPPPTADAVESMEVAKSLAKWIEETGIIRDDAPATRIARCSLPGCTVEGSLPRCQQCNVTRYCCREHQKQHWKGGHRADCKALKEAREREIEDASQPYADAVQKERQEQQEGGGKGYGGKVEEIPWDSKKHFSIAGLPPPPFPTLPPRSPSAPLFVILHPLNSTRKDLDIAEKRAQKLKAAQTAASPPQTVRYLLYGSHDPAALASALEKEGGIVLLSPGEYETCDLGLPDIMTQTVEVWGVNGPPSSIRLKNGQRSDWFLVSAGQSSDRAQPDACALTLRNFSLVCRSGEAAVAARPGFTGALRQPPKFTSKVTVAMVSVQVWGDECGGLVAAHEGTEVLMRGCTLGDCPGAGVVAHPESSVTLESCVLRRTGCGDSVTMRGEDAAVCVDKSASVRVQGCRFESNYGHAVQLQKGDSASVNAEFIEKYRQGDQEGVAGMQMIAAMKGVRLEEVVKEISEKVSRQKGKGMCVIEKCVFQDNGMALERSQRKDKYVCPVPFHPQGTRIGDAIAKKDEDEESQRKKMTGGQSCVLQ